MRICQASMLSASQEPPNYILYLYTGEYYVKQRTDGVYCDNWKVLVTGTWVNTTLLYRRFKLIGRGINSRQDSLSESTRYIELAMLLCSQISLINEINRADNRDRISTMQVNIVHGRFC